MSDDTSSSTPQPGVPAAEVSPESTASAAGTVGVRPDPEVPAKATRRRFGAAYKLRVLEELDRTAPGERGAILRREGLYSSHIASWRKARREGALSTLSRKRGRKPRVSDPRDKRIRVLERENARLQEQLRKAQLILDVQGKVAGLLGIELQGGKNS